MASDRTSLLTHPVVICLLAMVCCALWGSAFPCIKIGYRLFAIAGDDAASQIVFAGIRFILAGIINFIIGSVIIEKPLLPRKKNLPAIFALSLFQTILQYLFFYLGLAHTTGVKASIITATNVFWAILLACFIFRQEKLSAFKLFGCLLGFVGVIVINAAGSGVSGGFSLTGDGFILLSALASGVSSNLIKRFSANANPVMLSAWQFIAGGVMLTVFGLALGGRVAPALPGAIPMLLYLGCLSAIAYSLWSVLLSRNPVSTVSVYGFMNPVAGFLLSALLLGEQGQASGLSSIAALVLVSLGIYIVNRD
jgi:drug/metabolite transporter (DMT)-like permease